MVLDFDSSRDAGRLVLAVEGAGEGNDVSECEPLECREREQDLRADAAVLGYEDELGDGEGLPLFLHTPFFMAPANKE